MGSQQKKKERTEDTRSLTSEIKRTQDLDVNKLALQPSLEVGHSPVGVGTTSYVNVSTAIVTGTQTSGSILDTTPPVQVTGLNATAATNTIINLTWVANADSDINHYNVYRGTTPGFAVTLGTTTPTATPSANSYSDTGRTTSTTYYYKVAAVDNAGNIGPISAEINCTTLAAPPSPPAQITGLTVIPQAGSDTQLNLAWTASAAPAFSYYNVYNGPAGFTPAPAYKIAQVSTNSYPDTGLSSGNTYYYRVTAVDTLSQEGSPSVQASGTTTTTASSTVFPSIELHLNSDFVDSSPNAFPNITGGNRNGFILPGAFGTAGWKCNTPIASTSSAADYLYFQGQGVSKPTALYMDSSVGFSVSLWVYPTDLSALSLRRILIENVDDNGFNMWTINVDSAGTVYFFVKKNGNDYKAQVTGLVTGSWQHIAATFNATTNSPIVYRNTTAGTSSTAALQDPYHSSSGDGNGALRDMHIAISYLSGSYPPGGFVGYYDEIRYYKSVVLTPTQIADLRNTNAIGTGGGPPDVTPPAQVIGLVATGTGDSIMSLSWTSNTESDLNHYNIYRGTSSGFSITPGVTTPTGTATVNSFSDTGLTSSTTYYYKVLAVDNTGNLGTLSSQASGTTQATDVTPPAQTVGLTVAVIGSSQLNLSWTASVASDLNHYNVYRGTTSGFSITPGVTTPTGTSTTNSFSDVSLSPSTTYYYKVLAADNSGNLGTLSTQAQGTTQAVSVVAPAQVTGLIGRPFGQGNKTVFLMWNANTEPDLNQYNIYRGTTAGFTVTPGVTVPFATRPAGTTQKFGDGTGGVGYSPSTTYYFKVAAVDTDGDIGPTSAEISVSVASTTTITPNLYCPLNGDQNDYAGNDLDTFGYHVSGYTQPGQFGTHGITWNWPIIPTPSADMMQVEKFVNPVIMQMDPVVGFSVAFWIYPQTLSALAYRRVLAEKADSLNQKWTLQIDSAGILYFFVKKAGTIYKRQISGFTTGAWQHVAATFNGATNTPQVYRNGVAGVSSTATPQWPGSVDNDPLGLIFNVGKRTDIPTGTTDISDGGNANTAYQGYMDEFLWYRSYVLSATEVTNLVNTNVTNTSGAGVPVPTPTPNLWLKLDGNYTDSSGLGNSVIPSNASGFAVTGQFGTNSVKLNTPSIGPDYISVTDNTNVQLDLVTGFSYSFWIYPTSSAANQYILSKRIDSNNYFTCYFNGTDIVTDCAEAGVVDSRVANAATVPLNTWHHVVVVYSGTMTRGFVDMFLPLYPPIGKPPNFVPTVTTNLIIGNLSGDTSGTKAFRGQIDEVQYFKGVRFIQKQVNNLYSTNAP